MYELTVVLPEKASPSSKKAVVDMISKIVEVNGGKVVVSQDLGVKEFAYPIKKNTSGTYLYFELELEPKLATILNEKIRVEEGIIRHLLVKEG